MFNTSGSQGHAKGVPDGGVHRRAHLGRGIGWMTALLLTSTPSWGQYLIDYPNGNLTLQQVINMAATDPGADGVRVLASNTSDLVVPPTFFDHVVSGPEAFSGRRIVVTTDGQGQPYRLARRLSVQTNLSYPGELRVEGGWLGNDWDMGVPYDGLAVCDIQQAAVSFFGTQFKRYQLQNGDWEEDCDLENRGPLVLVNGMQPLEDSGNETFSDFHYDVSRSVDFVDCVFQPQVDVTPSGCTEVEFPDPLIHATGARIRVLRPAFEILGYGSSYDFQLAPVFGANSMIHIEDSILDGVMGMEAGFVQASACPSFSSPQGTVPGLFLNDVEMSNGVGIKAGAVSIEGVTLARLVDCLFEDNTATGTSAGVFNTGAVRLLSCDEAEVLDCVFTGNEGDASGALTTKRGVSTPSFNRPKLKIHESTGGETRFSGNLGRNGAGALYVYSTKDILIKGVEFSGNGVLSPGNALTAATAVNVRWSGRTTSYTDPEIGLIKCLVNGNTPSEGESTGAVRFEACPAYVKDCEFSGDNGTIALRVAVTGTDVNAALIEDNRFVDQDVAIDLFLRRSATATTASYIRNNVFANSEHFGLFLRVDASGSEENAMLLVDGNTFRDTENLSIFFGEPLMRKVHLT